MWQLSFVLGPGDNADELRHLSSEELKQEALRRTRNWHEPVATMISSAEDVWGTELFDVGDIEIHKKHDPKLQGSARGRSILIGDAMHAMSPFKGQGANQSLIDAVQVRE